jgi:hypothetical protein
MTDDAARLANWVGRYQGFARGDIDDFRDEVPVEATLAVLADLAQAQAELAEARASHNVARGMLKASRLHVAEAEQEMRQVRGELEAGKATIRRVKAVRCWTNEDRRNFLFADDLWAALYPAGPTAVGGGDAHSCRNCEGIDPDSCLMNPDRTRDAQPGQDRDYRNALADLAAARAELSDQAQWTIGYLGDGQTPYYAGEYTEAGARHHAALSSDPTAFPAYRRLGNWHNANQAASQ